MIRTSPRRHDVTYPMRQRANSAAALRRSATVIAFGLVVISCDAQSVDMTVSLQGVHRDRVVLDVETEPNLFITTHLSIEDAPRTDVDGRAEVVIELGEQGQDLPSDYYEGRVVLDAVAEGLLGDNAVLGFGEHQVVAQESLDLGIDFRKLRSAPEHPTHAWARAVGAGDITNEENCLRLKAPAENANRLGLIAIGDSFFGSPGAEVTIAATSFKIEDSGLGTYRPEGADLVAFLPAQLEYSELPVKIQAEGLELFEAVYEADLEPKCMKLIGEHLQDLVQRRVPLVEGVEPSEDLAIVARAQGLLETRGTRYDAVGKGRRSKTRSKRLAAARYLFFETETGREKGPSCEKTTRVPSQEHAGMDEINTWQVTPTFIDTRLTMVRLTDFEELESRDLTADRETCDHEVFPTDLSAQAWMDERIDHHYAADKKRPGAPKHSKK